MKKYLTAGVVLLIIILIGTASFYIRKYQKEKTERIRVENNQNQLMQDKAELTVLNLHKDELVGEYKERVKTLADSLKIRPKQVIKYVDVWLTQIDSFPVPVPVRQPNDSTYFISDSTKCFTYEGIAIIENDTMTFKRTLFAYHNRTTETNYWKRKWFLAKKKFYRDMSSECGETKTLEVNIVKGK